MGDLEINGDGKQDPEGGDQGDVVDDVEEEYAEEYAALDSTLDQLDSCLDALESKNDDLFGKLQALLEDSKQARMELQETSDNSNSETQCQSVGVEKLTIADGSKQSQENTSQGTNIEDETDRPDSQESSSQ